jgi:uncharacterized protein
VSDLLPSYLKASKKDCLLYLKIVPHSKQNEVVGILGDRLKLKIAAVPEKNKANKELCKFLSSILDLESSRPDVVKGHTSSQKTVLIKNYPAKNIELVIQRKLLINQPTLF